MKSLLTIKAINTSITSRSILQALIDTIVIIPIHPLKNSLQVSIQPLWYHQSLRSRFKSDPSSR